MNDSLYPFRPEIEFPGKTRCNETLCHFYGGPLHDQDVWVEDGLMDYYAPIASVRVDDYPRRDPCLSYYEMLYNHIYHRRGGAVFA